MSKLITLVIKKVGRKWLEVKEDNEYINGKLLIDDNTKDFEIGSEINILGDKEKIKNRYGTTITYVCEKVVEGEELTVLKEEVNKNKIKNSLLNDMSKYAMKFEQTNYWINSQSTIYKNFIETLEEDIEYFKKYNISEFIDAANNAFLSLYNNTNNAKVLDKLLKYSFVNNDNKILFQDKAILLREQYKIDEMNEFADKLKKYDYKIDNTSKIYTEFMEAVNNGVPEFQKVDIKLFLDALNDTIYNLIKSTENNIVLNELLTLSMINDENKELIENTLLEKYNNDIFIKLTRKKQVNELNVYTEIPDYTDKFNEENTQLYYSLMANRNNFSKVDSLKVMDNLYIKKDYEEFKKYLEYNHNNYIIDCYYWDKFFNKETKIRKFFDKYAYKGQLYILNIRIADIETFKKVLSSKIVVKVNALIENENYIVVNPWDLFDILVLKNEITVAKELTDVEKIRLWGRSIGDKFSFIKDDVYGQTYYFVTEEITNKYTDSSYNAYYLIGIDSEHGTGFQHRLPWEKSKYDNMSVKEIVDYTFGYKHGFKRVQGDVIAREVILDFDEVKEIETITSSSITLENGNSFTFVTDRIRNKFINNELVKDNDIFSYFNNKSFSSINKELRKDMRVVAEKSIQYNNCDMILFNGKITYKDEVILDFTDKCIYLRNYKDESFKKIKFNFYYLDAELGEVTSKEEVKYDNVITNAKIMLQDGSIEHLRLYNSLYKSFYIDISEHKEYIIAKAGEHTLEAHDYNRQYNIFEGPITIKHSSHQTVVFGEEGKYYQVALAIRHRTEK